MKSIITIFTISVLLISCKSQKQKIEDKSLASIKAFVNSIVAETQDKNFKSLDSVVITHIDTLTEKTELIIPMQYVLNKLKQLEKLTALQTFFCFINN